jgi:hypothetical protein
VKSVIRWTAVLVLIVTAVQLAACAGTPAAKEKVAPSKLEPIEGSDFKRVVLTEKAAERLDIQTAAVQTEPATRQRRVGAVVVEFPTGPTQITASDEITATAEMTGTELSRVWVMVNLSESEANQVDRSQPARVLLLTEDDEEDSDEEEAGLEAEPDDDVGGTEDEEEAAPTGSTSLYYSVDNTDSTLTPGQPVFVELTLTGSGIERKVVPFAALLYGTHGETWVYTNPEPLVFVRAPVTVDYIDDEVAFLSEGPDVGTEVVTVGGSLLYGAETGVSK